MESCTTLELKVPLQWATCPLDTECRLLPCSHDTPASSKLHVTQCDAYMKIKSQTFKRQQNCNWGIQTQGKPEERTWGWDLSTVLCHGWYRHLLSPKAPQLKISKYITKKKTFTHQRCKFLVQAWKNSVFTNRSLKQQTHLDLLHHVEHNQLLSSDSCVHSSLSMWTDCLSDPPPELWVQHHNKIYK